MGSTGSASPDRGVRHHGGRKTLLLHRRLCTEDMAQGGPPKHNAAEKYGLGRVRVFFVQLAPCEPQTAPRRTGPQACPDSDLGL